MVKIELKLSAFYILEFLSTLSVDALACLSVSQIMRATHLSRRTVHLQLKWLRQANAIRYEAINHWTFAICLTEAGRTALKEHHNFGKISQL
jgi:DNA-binding IclR family transcriptional regulator